MGILAAVGVPALFALTWALQRSGVPEVEVLGFAREAPLFLLLVCVLYPLFSVYPQELLFRGWFFHRYEPLLGRGWPTILASGLCFGWAHLPFENAVAVGLCIPGGVLFAWNYHRSRSVLAASVEHAIYGDFVWVCGLGALFYSGAVAAS